MPNFLHLIDDRPHNVNPTALLQVSAIHRSATKSNGKSGVHSDQSGPHCLDSTSNYRLLSSRNIDEHTTVLIFSY